MMTIEFAIFDESTSIETPGLKGKLSSITAGEQTQCCALLWLCSATKHLRVGAVSPKSLNNVEHLLFMAMKRNEYQSEEPGPPSCVFNLKNDTAPDTCPMTSVFPYAFEQLPLYS